MNNRHFEQIRQADETYRRRINQEMESDRLYNRSRAYRPGIFERTMMELANWMISRGRRLRRKYEIPCRVCNQTTTGNYA